MNTKTLKVLIWLTLQWLLFHVGFYLAIQKGHSIYRDIVVIFAPFLLINAIYIIKLNKIGAALDTLLEKHTSFVDNLPKLHISTYIALAAGITLFTELMLIRIHASYFQLFAYFKNISLLSCFLGLGVGYARGAKKPLATPLVLPFLALQIVLMYVLRFTITAQLLANPISEQFSFGIGQTQSMAHTLAVYGFLTFIFTFNTMCFIPLGHLVSRLMMRQDKLVAYSWNLLGSLIGISLFSFLSFLWTTPSVWFIMSTIGLLLFFRKDFTSITISITSLAVLLVILAVPIRANQINVYSPYQILTLQPLKDRKFLLSTSNTYYQRILNLSKKNIQKNKKLKSWDAYYSFPYKFKPKPKDVLIVGSGTGNDVAAAIRNKAGSIDAVEIDPAILLIGKQLHPESPYQADNVNHYLNDARAFIRHTQKKYDLIVYGLLDSHVLLSGKSGGIRLDSYVYTVEAFKEAHNKLKKGGMISLTFSMLDNQLGRKLFLMLKEAFNGQDPIVYKINYDGGYTFLAGDGIRKHISYQHPSIKEATAQFSNSKIYADKTTDDWPFFYMPVKKYPKSYFLIMLLLMGISLAFVRNFVPDAKGGFSIPCFFLGAGFMLIETKGITELALVYGSTWIVLSIVITAILLMAFFANLIVIKKGSPPAYITYGLLLLSLIAGICFTFVDLSNFSPWVNWIIAPIVSTLPLFFSGFAFSVELKKSASVAVALSSNLLGAMLGGILEYNAMYFGFRSLYFFAIIMYLIAYWGTTKTR